MYTTATYSPEDDKVRIYPAARLDAETYGKVKAAGFSWAPKQELFVAVWNPEREDVARELAGEIAEEETTRNERAEERAERFETYSENRADDANAAYAEVSRLVGEPVRSDAPNVGKKLRLGQVGLHGVTPAAACDAVFGNVPSRTVEPVDTVIGEGAIVTGRARSATSPGERADDATVAARPHGEGYELLPSESEGAAESPSALAVDPENFGCGGEALGPLAGHVALAAPNVTAAPVEFTPQEVVTSLNDDGETSSTAALPLRGSSASTGGFSKDRHQAEGAADEIVQTVDHDARLPHVGVWTRGPILVGHHSERHARRDAKRIESGMRRAVESWKTSQYWQRRAEGVTSHAARMERSDVRARRVKTLEADLRKCERELEKERIAIKLWSTPGLTIERARALANVCSGYLRTPDGKSWSAWDVLQPDENRYAACPSMTVAEVAERLVRGTQKAADYSARWIEHLSNRLTFERAMLAAAGWEEPVKAKSLKASLPMLNYSGSVSVRNSYRDTVETHEAHPMTKAEYARIGSDYKGTRISACGTHKVRTAIVRGALVVVFLTDSKVHPLPSATAKDEAASRDTATAEALMQAKLERLERMRAARDAREAKADDKGTPFVAMAESLKAGVAVVAVSQLFPTPAALADRMVELAEIGETDRVLEPSAGTGALLDAIKRGAPVTAERVAVEISRDLSNRLENRYAADSVICGDFLAWEKGLGKFERVVMNPPFGDAADILHIRHALDFLTPGGRLVALCAAGPRQEKALRPLSSSWETIDAGTFAGTNVRAALLVIEKAVAA